MAENGHSFLFAGLITSAVYNNIAKLGSTAVYVSASVYVCPYSGTVVSGPCEKQWTVDVDGGKTATPTVARAVQLFDNKNDYLEDSISTGLKQV